MIGQDKDSKKPRARCDHQVTCQELVNCLHCWLASSRDLASRCQGMDEKWKSVPAANQIIAYVDLISSLVDLSESILFAPTLMKKAIISLEQEHGPINFSGTNLDTFSDDISGKIRCLCSKYRRMQDPIDRLKIYRQLTLQQQQQVEQVCKRTQAKPTPNTWKVNRRLKHTSRHAQ